VRDLGIEIDDAIEIPRRLRSNATQQSAAALLNPTRKSVLQSRWMTPSTSNFAALQPDRHIFEQNRSVLISEHWRPVHLTPMSGEADLSHGESHPLWTVAIPGCEHCGVRCLSV
jgi:hypothetical protein